MVIDCSSVLLASHNWDIVVSAENEVSISSLTVPGTPSDSLRLTDAPHEPPLEYDADSEVLVPTVSSVPRASVMLCEASS